MSSKETLLHYWLSEKRDATRQQLRIAWKGLSLADPDGMKLNYSLSRLWRAGHLELDAGGNASICPPIIVLANQSRTFASGARSLTLRRQLLERFPESEFICRPSECEVWQLTGSIESVREVAEELSLAIVDDRGLELLRALPDYQTLLNEIETSEELVASEWLQACWHHRTGCLSWRETASTVNSSLYRAKFGFQWKYVLRQESGSLKELKTPPERAAGLWICLRHENSSVCHVSADHSLQISPGLLPPVLLDRALQMCSGRPPLRKHGELHYTGVDLARAWECARLLCTPLQIE